MSDDETADRYGTTAWFEIHVNDLDRASDFYGKVFGWTYQPLAGFALGGYLLITSRSGAPVGGGLAQTAGRRPPGDESSIVYLYVDDIQSAVDAALASGGTLHRPRMDIGGMHGYCAIIRDPEGNHVGLWSHR